MQPYFDPTRRNKKKKKEGDIKKPKWKTNTKKDGRQPQKKNGRQPQKKMKMEDNLNFFLKLE